MNIIQGGDTERFIRDLLAYMPSKVLPLVTGLITAPILTRLFLPAEYGNWALATGVSDFLFALACSGIGSSAFRHFTAYKVRSELGVFFANLIATVGLAVGVVSVISLSILVLLHARIPEALYSLLFIGILVFIVQSIFTVFVEIIRVQNRSAFYTRINLFVNYSSLGLGLVLVLAFGLRVEGLMLGSLVVLFFTLPLLIRSTIHGISIKKRYFRASDMLTLWRYAWPLAIGNIAFWGLRLSDRYVIGFFRSGTEVGLYSAVYNLSDKTINVLVALFILSMGPMVINTWETLGREVTEETLAMITRFFLIICLPATVGLSLLALPFITLLTGEAYHEGYRIVGYVAFSIFAWGLSRIAGWGLLIHNKTRQFAINQMLAAVVNVGLNFILVPRYGFVAAGITTLIGYALLLFLQAYSSRAYLTWRFPKRTMLNVSIAVLIMGAVVFAINTINTQGGSTHFTRLFLSVLAGTFVYFGTLCLFGEISEEEKAVIKRFCQRIAMRPV